MPGMEASSTSRETMSVVILSSVPLQWYCFAVGGGVVCVGVVVGDDDDDVDDAVDHVAVLYR